MVERHPFRIYKKPEFQSPSLILGWSQDAAKLGAKVIDFLNKKLGSQEFGEIEPLDFFSLGGVLIEDDLVQFPASKFYSCEKRDLLLFKSDAPSHEHYDFLNLILDVAEHHCRVKEFYTIGGMVSLMAHTTPRRITAVANQPEFRKTLTQYDLELNIDYHTPPGGRPTLSTFLSWVAKRRNITGATLWVAVPFYLTPVEDPVACKYMLSFLDKRLSLGLDLGELDLEIERQNDKIRRLEEQNSEIAKYIELLERGIGLREEENEKLTIEVTKFLKKES